MSFLTPGHRATIHKTLLLLTALWVLFVTFAWLQSHAAIITSVTQAQFGIFAIVNALLPFLVPACITALVATYLIGAKKMRSISLTYSWFVLALSFVVFSLLLFNIAGFARVIYPDLAPYLAQENWLSYNVTFTAKALTSLLWMLLSTLAFYLCGHILSQFILQDALNSTPLIKGLVTITIGLGGWSVVLFILGYLNILTALSVSILFLGLMLSTYLTAKQCVLQFFSWRSATLDLTSLSFILAWLGVFTLGLSFVDALRGAPIGFDASTEYLNRAQLIAQSGALAPGTRPFTFSLLAAVGYLFSGNASFAIGSNVLYALLGALALYAFTAHLTSERKYGIIAAVLWLTLTMTTEFLSFDAKSEPLLFFVSAMAITIFFLWAADMRKTRLLWVTAFLLGLACTIKLAAAFLIVVLALCYVVLLLRKKITGTPFTRTLNFSLLFFLLPLIPWTFLSIVTGGYKEMSTATDVLISRNTQAVSLSHVSLADIGVNKDLCVSTGLAEDLGKFDRGTYGTVLDTILLPWTLSIDTYQKRGITEIGFVYLIFLPYVLYWVFRTFRAGTDTTRRKLFILASLTYWSFWIILGRHLIWYGFPGFFFLSILVALSLSHVRKHKILSTILFLAIVLGVLIMTLLHTTRFASHLVLHDVATGEQLQQKYFGTLVDDLDEGYILSTASQSLYRIARNDERVIRDNFLDDFMCLDQGRDDATTLARLQQLGITTVIYHRRAESNDATYKEKQLRFESFIENNLIVQKTLLPHIIYSVPR